MDETPHAGERMPEVIGRYQVQESIGYGAMGAVYKAFDPLIKRTLAIKTIRLDIPRQSPQYKSFIERFYHEARISGTLSHPNIVTLFDIGEEGGLPYLAMEYVEGETIASILERGLRFKPEKVIGLISQVASAIDYAHTKGVIHRDIKPSNLILFDGDRVKVTDFGIAKLVDAEMTQSGTLLGTPSYMSPEQAMGDKLDGRSDIFSLGVCAFEMLCGEQPFPGNNVTSILYKLVHVDPIEPANLEMNGLVPEKWHEVFGRVLAKKPDDRYQTATEFVQDLEYCLGAWFGAMGDEAARGSAVAGGPRGEEVTAALPALTDPAARKTHPPGQRPPTGVGNRSGMTPPSARKTHPPGPPTPPPSSLKGTPPPQKRTGPPGATGSGPRPAMPRPAEPEGDEPTVYLNAPVPAARRTGANPPPPSEDPAGGRGSGRPGTGARGRPAAVPDEDEPSTVVLPGPVRRTGGGTAARPMAERTPSPSRMPADMPITATAPSPVLAEARPRSTLTLILGGAGLVLFLIVLATAVIILIPPTGPSPAPPPPSSTVAAAPTVGRLLVETDPPGATVMIAGKNMATTPAEIELPFNVHPLRIELAGYQPLTDTVVLTQREPRARYKAALAKAGLPPVAMGTVDILVEPAEALVKIDGNSVGLTPLRGKELKTGRHEIEVSKEGFEPFSRRVTVREGATERVTASLRAARPTPAPTPITTTTTVVVTTTTTVPPPVLVPEDQTNPKPQKAASCEDPKYPDNLPPLGRGQRVPVTVQFVVLETGEVADVEIIESAGPDIDQAVINAYRTCRFTPGMRNGVRVRTKVARRPIFRGGP